MPGTSTSDGCCGTPVGDDVPEMPDPRPFEAKAAGEVDLDGFGAVVFTSGFRPDYGGWVNFPVFDERGFPIVDDALATAVPGLYFCGVHFLRKRRSSLLFGVGEDAAIVARTITKALTASPRLHEMIRPTQCSAFATA